MCDCEWHVFVEGGGWGVRAGAGATGCMRACDIAYYNAERHGRAANGSQARQHGN